jgi:hypothetical protein
MMRTGTEAKGDENLPGQKYEERKYSASPTAWA